MRDSLAPLIRLMASKKKLMSNTKSIKRLVFIFRSGVYNPSLKASRDMGLSNENGRTMATGVIRYA